MDLTEDCCVPEDNPHPAVIEHLERYRFAAKYCNGMEVLDIACGAGYGSAMLLKEGNARAVLGIDHSAKNVAYCRHKYRYDRLSFLQGDICNVSLKQQFDLIACFETIEHVSKTSDALNCLHALLKSNGRLLISTPNRRITNPGLPPGTPTMDGAHKREFTPGEMRAVFKNAHFIELGYYGQRLQKCYENPLMERYYKRLFKPGNKTRAIVEAVERLEPEYMIFELGK